MKNNKPRYFRLTKSENEIMELMWKEGHPLSRSEIIELTPDRTWKSSSIHILLNSMLDKKAIEVAGFVQSAWVALPVGILLMVGVLVALKMNGGGVETEES